MTTRGLVRASPFHARSNFARSAAALPRRDRRVAMDKIKEAGAKIFLFRILPSSLGIVLTRADPRTNRVRPTSDLWSLIAGFWLVDHVAHR